MKNKNKKRRLQKALAQRDKERYQVVVIIVVVVAAVIVAVVERTNQNFSLPILAKNDNETKKVKKVSLIVKLD